MTAEELRANETNNMNEANVEVQAASTKPHPEEQKTEYKVSGRVESELFYNPSSNWGIYLVSTEDDIPHTETISTMVDGQLVDKQAFKLVGPMQQLYIGSKYIITMKPQYSTKYAEHQYKPETIISTVPKDMESKKAYLSSLSNVEVAENILALHPTIIEDCVNGDMAEDSLDVRPIKGLGKITWHRLYEAIMKNYVISDIIAMLQPLGVTFNMINKLFELEENPGKLKKKLEQNPYTITQLRGIGFTKADQFALKLKPEMRESKMRLTAFMKYFLNEKGDDEGHSWITIDAMKRAITDAVPECKDYLDEVLEEDEDFHTERNLGSGGKKTIGLEKNYKTEGYVFNKLIEVANCDHKLSFSKVGINDCIQFAEDEQGFTYTDEQKDIIRKALDNNLAVISGVAGSGKTSISRGILKAYEMNGYKMACMAMSAKAAQRIIEATGYPAATIHRSLCAQGLDKFGINAKNPIKADVVFVDECSMINSRIFYHLFCAVNPNKTRIILVGDALQLPPIGVGNIFADILVNKVFSDNTFKLTEPLRQAKDSGILMDANMIRRGENPLEKPEKVITHGEKNDMIYMFRTNREAIFKNAIGLYMKAIKKYGIDNVAIISPRRKNCLNSTERINYQIETMLNGKIETGQGAVKNGHKLFHIGTQVMQVKNNYEKNVFNGEMGKVMDCFTEKEGKTVHKFVEVEFIDLVTGDKKSVEYNDNEVNELDLAYALTTHKCQGSDFPLIIGVVDSNHYTLLDSCLLYTLVTRSKKKCILLAEPQAFNTCIKRNKTINRQTYLKYFENWGAGKEV